MKKILLAVLFVLFSTSIHAAGGKEFSDGVGLTPPGDRWEWASSIGALRAHQTDPDVYLFDTYTDMTTSKEVVVGYNEVAAAAKKKLTPLGFDLRERLKNLDDVPGVAIIHRQFIIQKFPLVRWKDLLPKIQAILDRPIVAPKESKRE